MVRSLIDKLRRHLAPGFDFDPAQHWPVIKPIKRMRLVHKGIKAHPVRHLMNHDLAGNGRDLLHLHQHRIRQNKTDPDDPNYCDHPICINPQHYHVEVNRKLLGITPAGVRVYNEEERYVIPVFSWQDKTPDPANELEYQASFDPLANILDQLEYELGKIEDWKKLPAEQLHAQLGDPDFTVEMIRKLQK